MSSCQNGHLQSRLEGLQSSNSFLIRICENLDLIHKTIPTQVFYDLQSTKSENFRSKCLATCHKKLQRSWTSYSHLCKASPHFTKVTLPLNPAALGLQNLEKLARKSLPRASRRSGVLNFSFMCYHAPLAKLTHIHAPMH